MHSLMVRPEAMQAESARHSRRMVFWMLQLEDIGHKIVNLACQRAPPRSLHNTTERGTWFCEIVS